MADVFISYRKADRARAEALAKALKIENLDVWWDTALETGQTFDEKIQAALEQCKAVIVIWSKESVKSDWVRAESSIGRERSILVPVMIQPVNIPVPFNLLHTADLISWHGDRAHSGYRDVVKQVKTLAGKSHVAPLKPPPNRALRTLWRTVAVVGMLQKRPPTDHRALALVLRLRTNLVGRSHRIQRRSRIAPRLASGHLCKHLWRQFRLQLFRRAVAIRRHPATGDAQLMHRLGIARQRSPATSSQRHQSGDKQNSHPAFTLSIHCFTRVSRIGSGNAPPPRTVSWKPAMVNLSPSSFCASARSSRIFSIPILYAVA